MERSTGYAAESAPPADAKAEKPRPSPAPAVIGQRPGGAADARRERPSRERTDRPGDERQLELEQAGRHAEQEFQSADRDGSGYLSRDEVRGRFPRVAKEFERADADGDGLISGQEFLRLRRAQAERIKKQ